MMRRQLNNQPDYYSKIFYDVSALVLKVMRSPPPPFDFADPAAVAVHRRGREGPPFHQITPAGFASLLLGISLALMLCGSVTFFLGFLLMPWVLVLVVILYVVGIVSSISMIGRAIWCHNSAPISPRKDIPLEAFVERLSGYRAS
ncbi:uncharacterized protein LOC127241166 [Andrographis paniculata]|uniref:uncharacterized protein LOC127241166 n=1 Tax=Andrographis paniculata TaxID=175694 RepID=UPI0021E7F515|nr:uncharacterized protein LOC127241166 [Andrographis paniculata]